MITLAGILIIFVIICMIIIPMILYHTQKSVSEYIDEEYKKIMKQF